MDGWFLILFQPTEWDFLVTTMAPTRTLCWECSAALIALLIQRKSLAVRFGTKNEYRQM